jgi:hypothetical protein
MRIDPILKRLTLQQKTMVHGLIIELLKTCVEDPVKPSPLPSGGVRIGDRHILIFDSCCIDAESSVATESSKTVEDVILKIYACIETDFLELVRNIFKGKKIVAGYGGLTYGREDNDLAMRFLRYYDDDLEEWEKSKAIIDQIECVENLPEQIRDAIIAGEFDAIMEEFIEKIASRLLNISMLRASSKLSKFKAVLSDYPAIKMFFIDSPRLINDN